MPVGRCRVLFPQLRRTQNPCPRRETAYACRRREAKSASDPSLFDGPVLGWPLLECGGWTPLWMFGFLDGRPRPIVEHWVRVAEAATHPKDPKRSRATALQESAGESTRPSKSDGSLVSA